MEQDNTGRVILTLDQYSELVIFKTKYIALVNALLYGSELGWRDETIKINVEAANAVFRACEPTIYESAFNHLKHKKEATKDE